MKKEIKEKFDIRKTVKDLSNEQLIFYVQDFNRPNKEHFYSEKFKEAVNKEISWRGKLLCPKKR